MQFSFSICKSLAMLPQTTDNSYSTISSVLFLSLEFIELAKSIALVVDKRSI